MTSTRRSGWVAAATCGVFIALLAARALESTPDSAGARVASARPASRRDRPSSRVPLRVPRPAASGSPTASHPRSVPTPTPSFDVDAVLDQARRGFAITDDGFRSEQPTHDVRIDADGRIAVRAVARRDDGTRRASAKLSLRTVAAFAADGEPMAPTVARAEEGHVRMLRGAAIEEARNVDAGLEQTWTLAARPAIPADADVRIEVEGMRFVAATSTGLHFRDRASGLGLRYGHGTLVDAEGTRTPVESRYEDGEIRLTVPANVLADAAYPVVLDPVITPEFDIDQVVLVGIPLAQDQRAITWGGTQYLVAWRDVSTTSILASRVSATGVALDSGGIAIDSVGQNAQIAWNGVEFLVTYGFSGDVYAKRVAPDGTVLDATALKLSNTPTALGLEPHAVTAVGTDFAVAWVTYGTGTDVLHGCVVDTNGVLTTPVDTLIQTAPTGGNLNNVSLASDGTSVFVVYEQDTSTSTKLDLNSRTLTRTLGLVATNFLTTLPLTNSMYPDAAFNGTDYVVTWHDDRNAVNEIFAARVSTAGVPLGAANGFRVSGTNVSATGSLHATAIGANVLVTWINGPNGYGHATIHPDESITDAAGSSGGPPSSFEVATDGTNLLFAYTTGSPSDIFGRFSDATGTTLGAAHILSAYGPDEDEVALAWNGTHFLVVAHDEGLAKIRGVRVTPAGQPVDFPPIDISTGTLAAGSINPTVASAGGNFLVRWSTGSGALVLANGVVQSVSGSMGGDVSSSVASNGTNYLALQQTSGSNSDITAVLVSTAGVVSATPFNVAIATGAQRNARAATNGTDYLVVWEDTRTGSADIYGARVSGAGAVIGGAINIATATGSQALPCVASNGTDYFVAWRDARNGTTDIYGARVTAAGTVTDTAGLVLSNASGAEDKPSVAWTGADYLVVFESVRGASADLIGTRISTAGVVESPSTGVVFSNDATTDELHPSIVAGPTLSLLLAYERGSPASFGATRPRARVVSYGSGAGSVCTSGSGCDSGFCVDGVCCLTACAGGTSDCQACSIAGGGLADGTCGVVLPGRTCRAQLGPCDAAELCSGSSTACPADGFQALGTTCRAAVGTCDIAEQCTGSSGSCSGDAIATPGTSCRVAAGPCDVPESCDGLDGACPSDAYVVSGTTCRAVAGTCDQAEVCSGSDAACPGDLVLSTGTTCRVAAGPCDVSESCSGSSAICPLDTFASSSLQCGVGNGPCDFADFCTGTAAACPNAVAPNGSPCSDQRSCTSSDACAAGVCIGALDAMGTVCHASNGPCDLAETCDGVADQCPADSVLPPSVVCRNSTGACDAPETCNGVSAACPGDVPFPMGSVCRLPSGSCDAAETCDGISSTCPTDAFATAGTECREANGICDVAETCTGVSEQCPTNGYVLDGTTCDDSLACTQASECRLGGCAPTLVLDCTDGNACTTDTCAEPYGCAHAVLPACMGDGGPRNDAGPGGDAGSEPPTSAAGCSCRVSARDSGAAPASAASLGLLLVLGMRARRRRIRA